MTAALSQPSCRVYTPKDLAEAIVRAVEDEPGAVWLEPSHGRGAFVRALADIGVPNSRITAMDLDPTPSEADQLAQTTRAIDFIDWATTTGKRFDRIVGNPPYVAINRLENGMREAAARVTGPDCRPIGVGSNMWYAFVLCSLRLLKFGGTLAFVLPSAAEYADYSASIRDALRGNFESLELYRCRRPLFEGVQEGTVVAVARGHGKGPCRFRRRVFRTPKELVSALMTRRIKASRQCPRTCAAASADVQTLGDVAEIRLGGVTGDVRYFLMTESQREEWNLPEAALTPVLTRARHLRAGVITRRVWNALQRADERVWLFNPDDAAARDEVVRRRLMLDIEEGGCRRSAYKVASRSPWYRTPLPDAPHGFMSGMGASGPWIALNAMPTLNATNTLYVVTFRTAIRLDERFQIAMSLLTSDVHRQFRRSARRYADGLLKHEPGSLTRVSLPQMKRDFDYRLLYSRAVGLLLDGNLAGARQVADGCKT
jgi:adenine-specific DNA-methyltransferase